MRMGGSPCLRRRNADGDHTHALVAQQSHSFLDNLVALLAGIRAWNCSTQNTSSSIEPCACPSLHLLPPCCPAPPTPCLPARDGSSSPSGTAFERWCFATATRSYCRAATRSP